MNEMPQLNKQHDDISNLKVPPHAIDAEKAVIGGLLLVASAWDKVAGKLAEADFYLKNHRQIFKAIAPLA